MRRPRFKARDERDRLAFRDYVIGRLHEDERHLREESEGLLGGSRPPVSSEARRKDELDKAKQLARAGDPEPLRKIVAADMRDTEIAEFIYAPKRARGQRDHVGLAYREFSKSIVIDTVRRIRQILREDFGAVKRRADYGFSVEEIAGEVHRMIAEEVQKIMKKARPGPR
jgi:hypothetical protein